MEMYPGGTMGANGETCPAGTTGVVRPSPEQSTVRYSPGRAGLLAVTRLKSEAWVTAGTPFTKNIPACMATTFTARCVTAVPRVTARSAAPRVRFVDA